MKWFGRLFRKQQLEEQLEKELNFHIAQHTADLVARGVEPAKARRQAALGLGGREQVKESCRDARGTRWLEDLWHDVRFALRTMRRMPAFTAVALLTLALGTGATTVMFTVINGVLLRPLPYPGPDRLFRVDEQTKGTNDFRWGDRWAFAYPNYLDCRAAVRSLSLAAWRRAGGTISGTGDPEYVDGLQVSSDLFGVMGVSLFRGRAFLPAEDRPGAEPVAILSYDLWKRRFGGDPAALGKPLVFDGQPYTIIGIARPEFRLVDAEVLTPIGRNDSPTMRDRSRHPGISVWARLRPGATAAEAQSELDAIGHSLARRYPDSNRGRGFIAEPLRPDVGDVRGTLWLLLGAVSLVLLIACTNIASLLLARALARERELAMRVALGAGRGRLIRQCVTESFVLAIAGGIVGIAAAAAGIRPFLAFWPGSLPRAEEVRLDGHVLLFALGLSMLCGILFGVAPALRAPARDLERVLRAGGRAAVAGSHRLHSGFVACEIALALVLLVCAGMLGRTLLRLASVDPGLNIHNVLTTRFAISPGALANPARIRTAWQDVLQRGRSVPGVKAIAMVDTVPMREGNNPLGFWTAPPEPARGEKPMALANCVTPGYLNVMRIPLLRGRFFTEHDRLDSEPVIVIDELLARHAFGSQDAVGKRLWTDMGPAPARVIGVVGHVRYWGLAADDKAAVRDQFYYPFSQVPDRLLRRWSELMSIAVRTGINPQGAVEPLKHALRGAAGDQVLYETQTLEQLARASIARQRFLMLLFAVFASLALLLASIGVYGVLAYLTTRRVPEFGVRMALGATARDIVRLVFRQSIGVVGAGVLAGLAASIAAARALEHLVEGMQAEGPWEFLLTFAALIASAMVASFLPARRAGRIDPMRALRQD